jgi:hypothetical protein
MITLIEIKPYPGDINFSCPLFCQFILNDNFMAVSCHVCNKAENYKNAEKNYQTYSRVIHKQTPCASNQEKLNPRSYNSLPAMADIAI